MAAKKKATAVASKSKVGKTTAKKATPPKKTVVKKVVSKKTVAKKPAVTAKAKKAIKKEPVKKAASKLSKSKKAPITQKTPPAKKTAKAGVKKAAPKKLAEKKQVVSSKKTTLKKEKTSQKKSIPPAKKQVVKPVKQKPLKNETSNQPANTNHKAELKKAIAKVKSEKKVEKRIQKAFVMPKTNTEKARKYEPEFTKSVLDQTPPENNGPTMRYSDSELIEFRELITRKLDTAKKELGYLQGLITRKDQMGGDESDNRYMTMEDGSLSMEREQLSQMASRQITFIDHLEKAMMRIENKTYGICRVTGKLIDKARLRAVPHATLSIEAKMGASK